jgi:flagellin
MGFRIQNNISAMTTLNWLNRNNAMLDQSLERLSSGYRINTGADDAAGLSSSMRMRAEISSLKVASRNASEATSMLQVAEGAMSQIDLIIKRLKELATQAASSNTGVDRAKLSTEATELTTEINRITGFTKYNGQTLLDGSYGATTLSASSVTAGSGFGQANGVEYIDVNNAAGGVTFAVTAASATANTFTLTNLTSNVSQQVDYTAIVGADPNDNLVLDFNALGVKMTVNRAFAAGEALLVANTTEFETVAGTSKFQIGSENNSNNQLSFGLNAVNMAALNGGAALTVDLTTQASAQTALDDIEGAISYLATQRGLVGSYINRFSYASSNLAVSIENKTASESTIRDVDMAGETSSFTKAQILVQSSTAMLAQANSAPQAVLSLLR